MKHATATMSASYPLIALPVTSVLSTEITVSWKRAICPNHSRILWLVTTIKIVTKLQKFPQALG